MSLVNDLLIEAERRRSAERLPRAPHLEDLVPTRSRSSERSRRRRDLGLLVGLSTLAGLVIVGAAYLGAIARPFDPANDGTSTAAAVGARRELLSGADEEASGAQEAAAERPVRVESISVERWPGTTRLRIVADGRSSHRLEHDPATGRLELVLSNAVLSEPTDPFDLLDTPIRSLDLLSETPDLRLRLALDADVQTQTRWLALEHGAALVLDLGTQPSFEPVAAREESAASAIEYLLPRRPASVSAAPDLDAPAETPPSEVAAPPLPSGVAAPAALAPSDTGELFDSERAIASTDPGVADRVYSPSLGDPAAMRIERSQRERERAERAARRAKREGLLASARHARRSGRLEDADAHYAEIVLLAPNDPTPIAEWADLLVEQDRVPDALALIDSARERAPRDQTLLIAKARLLERTGEIAAAIELLDQSGLALTEAPDIQALAAAYQQRAGHHEAAVERYEQILRRFPEEPRGWLGLGISLEALDRRREARDVYRIALTVGELPGSTRHWVTGRLSALGEED